MMEMYAWAAASSKLWKDKMNIAGGVFFEAKEYPSRTLPKKVILDISFLSRNQPNASVAVSITHPAEGCFLFSKTSVQAWG